MVDLRSLPSYPEFVQVSAAPGQLDKDEERFPPFPGAVWYGITVRYHTADVFLCRQILVFAKNYGHSQGIILHLFVEKNHKMSIFGNFFILFFTNAEE